MNKMNTSRNSTTLTLALFLFAFFIITSDMCMKSKAQGTPVVSFPCVSPKPCVISKTFTCPCIKNQCKCGRPPIEDNNSIPSFSIEN
ncbi:unnamed protein product [Trifolium pratense]|uniref:Uncharacterized protein n=1 Tax=Trifolium pratense TaxID=57577 RepID=A0ACB0KCR7_TRIPR|nr:unnamed protein product [Trifolium pratense]